jgi:DNA recombination protein RmuC
MDNFIYFGVVIFGAAIGALCAALLAKSRNAVAVERAKSESQAEVAKLSERYAASEKNVAHLRVELGTLNLKCEELRGSLTTELSRTAGLEAEIRRDEANRTANQTLLSEQFRNLANNILEDKSRRFTEMNKQNMEATLLPLQDRLKEFEKQVNETYDKESKQRFSLEHEIKNLRELNARISTEAVNLTNALKGHSKTQGNWGEMILERVLEMSGLVKGREYDVQVSMEGSDGRRFQPDVVINLPEGRHLVIDSKVNLIAYERYCSLDEGPERELALKSHCVALRRHFEDLSVKRYQDLYKLNSLDFVLLFVPIEGAFTLAVQFDSSFFDEAFSRNIVVVCPTTLLATMRTIGHIWRQEKQNQNVKEIVTQAGDLYDKLAGFVKDMQEVDSKLHAAQKSFDSAFNKLSTGRGNLLSRAEKIRALGAKTSKQLPGHLLGEQLADEVEDEVEVLDIT